MLRRLLCLIPLAAGCQRSPDAQATRAAAQAVTTSHEFTCDTTAVTADTVLRELGGGAGALVLRPTGDPCRYHLLHRAGDGQDRVLSHEPGMYFVTAVLTGASSDGPSIVVCATDLAHNPSDAASTSDNRVQRVIAGATLSCAAQSAGQWSATRTLVDGGDAFAAWAYDVEAAPSGGFVVRWVRDSTFQYLNLANTGRPTTDGVYETTFELGADGAPLARDTVQTSTDMVAVDVASDG